MAKRVGGRAGNLSWVDWFNNHRLFGPIGHIPPAEAEANYYAAEETSIWPHDSNETASEKPETLQTFMAVFTHTGFAAVQDATINLADYEALIVRLGTNMAKSHFDGDPEPMVHGTTVARYRCSVRIASTMTFGLCRP
jgi:hypothetical protein